jgi:hypothetical protein
VSAEETRLAIALASGPAGAALLAALLVLTAASASARPVRWLVWPAGLLLFLALGAAVGALVLSALAPPGMASFDVRLFAWSPLGLYGVAFDLHVSPAAAVLSLPALVLAFAAWVRRVRRERRGRPGDAAALLALSGALWTTLAGDLVTQYLGVTLFLLGTAAVLWATAGAARGGGRLVLAGAAGAALLACVLTLGKVNGIFILSQLSTAGFTGPAFFGLALCAGVVVAAPPAHAWLLRLARHPYGPALAAAGVAAGLALLLGAFRTTAGALPPGWPQWLIAYGWAATLAAAVVAVLRRAPAVRLAALFTGKAGMLFFATAIATPVSVAAAVLYVALALPALGFLWWLAAARSEPRPGEATTGAGGRTVWRRPGFWLLALILASAADLPGTASGAAGGAFVRALTSWPSGDLTLRVPPFLLNAAVLIVGGGLLWGGDGLPAARGLRERAATQRRRTRISLLGLSGWRGWALLVPTAVLVIAPAILPWRLIGHWFGPVAAAAAGTGTAPLTLDLSRIPTVPSAVLAVLALWVLVQRLRGREWLPGPLRGLVGIAILLGGAVSRAGREAGVSTAPARWAGTAWGRLQGAAERVVGVLRPFEERYYAAAAVMVAVAMIYIIGR